MAKIVIDARMYGLEHAGIGRYVANLVKEIRDLKLKNQEIILLVRKKDFKKLKREVGSDFRLVSCSAAHYSLQEQIIVPLQLIKLKPDLVHFPHFNVPVFWWGKQVVTIHDLIKHQSRGPETTTRWQPFYWFKYFAYRLITWLAVRRAKKVIVPSQWWKKKLIEYYHLQPEKVAVTYEGVEVLFSQKRSAREIQSVLKRYRLRRPFVIYTGSLYPHKNIPRLIQAILYLNDANHLSKPLSLVIVCSRNVFYQRLKKEIKQMRAGRWVKLVGFVPDRELGALYRAATAFVFPSLLEGFGLPGLEAMAAGLPVVASNSSCLPEIYGQAALYFDPRKKKEIAAQILRVLSDKEIRAKLIEAGFRQVRKYSWQKMAQETLRVYQSVLASN